MPDKPDRQELSASQASTASSTPHIEGSPVQEKVAGDITQGKPEEKRQEESKSERPAAQGPSEPYEPAQVKDIKYYWNLARTNRLKAFGLLFLIVVGFPVWNFVTANAPTLLCSHASVLCGKAKDQAAPRIEFSTKPDRCLNGHLSYKLRNVKVSAEWGTGMERLVVCADAIVEASLQSELLTSSARRFPRCMIISNSGGKVVVSANYNSGVVCRAPFTRRDFEIEPSSYEADIDLCLPEHDGPVTKEVTRFVLDDKGTFVYACDPNAIKAFGF